MRGERYRKREESLQGRETGAGRMARLIGMLPDTLLEEALTEKTAEAESAAEAAECAGAVREKGFEQTRTKKRRFPAGYQLAAAACLVLFFAGVWWGRFLRLPGRPVPESVTEREEAGEAGAGVVEEGMIADGCEQNTKPEEKTDLGGGFSYGGQFYRDAGREVLEILPDGWSLLGYLAVTGGETLAELETDVVSLAGCPVYGKTKTAEGDESVLAAAGMYVRVKDGYRLYLPEENDKQEKGETDELG